MDRLSSCCNSSKLRNWSILTEFELEALRPAEGGDASFNLRSRSRIT